jgi:hypothetical protein
MKRAGLLLSLAIVMASGDAFAQGAGDDPVEQLRACSKLEHAERLQCLERLSRDIAPPPASSPPPPAAEPVDDNWIVSETTSPVDYTPVVVATRYSRGGGSAMQLFINCRGGRTEVAVAVAALARGEVPAISYRVNDGQPVQAPSSVASSGVGVAFGGDVVRLLASLPEDGSLAVRVSTRQGATYDGYFPLSGLKAVRAKVAAACKWPATAMPRN